MNNELRVYMNNFYQALIINEREPQAVTRVKTRQDLLIGGRRFLKDKRLDAYEIEELLTDAKDQASTWVAGRRDWNYDKWGNK